MTEQYYYTSFGIVYCPHRLTDVEKVERKRQGEGPKLRDDLGPKDPEMTLIVLEEWENV